MTLETPTDFFSASVRLTQTGLTRPAAVTFGIHVLASPGITAAADAVLASLNTTIRGTVDTSTTIGPVTLHGGDASNPLSGSSTAAPFVGNKAGTSLPPNVGALLEKVTGRGGRRGRGRLFLPFSLQQADVNEVGALTAAVVTSLTTAWNNLRTTLTSNGVPMVLLHSTGISSTGDPDVVTSIVVDPIIGSQRRRLGR